MAVSPHTPFLIRTRLSATDSYDLLDDTFVPSLLCFRELFVQIRVWKITSGKVAAETQLPVRATHVRYSPDGKALAAGMAGGHVRFLTSESLQPIAQVRLGPVLSRWTRGLPRRFHLFLRPVIVFYLRRKF